MNEPELNSSNRDNKHIFIFQYSIPIYGVKIRDRVWGLGSAYILKRMIR